MELEGFVTSNADLAVAPTNLAAGSFKGLSILVTGGGGGLGRATAWLAARLGARVAIAGRKMDRLAPVIADMQDRGYDAVAVAADIRRRETLESLYDNLAAQWGGAPDIVVNSAGGQFPQPAIDFAEKGWKAVIENNLHGSYNLMQATAMRWQSQGRPGSIVNIVVSTRGLHHVAHTCAARAGVIALSESMSAQFAASGIRINCVAPGAIRTEGWAVYSPLVRARCENTNPMRQAGTPMQVAEAVLFVGGPAGALMSGRTLQVTGGGHLWGEVWTTDKPTWFRDASRYYDQD